MSNYFDRPSIQIVDPINGHHIMTKLERCARTCYQSEDKEHKTPTVDFLKGIIKSGHTSVLEHESITINLTTNRGVLAELTRHRIGVGYSVESTRYVNYENGVHFILPLEYDFAWTGLPVEKKLEARRKIFEESVETSAYAYGQLIKNGAKPQEARSVLPQALRVNMKVTMNIRAWRHFFELRCAPSAHPDIKEIAIALLIHFNKKMLPLFEDIKYDTKFYEKYHGRIDKIVTTSQKAERDELEKELERRMLSDSTPTGKKLVNDEDVKDKDKDVESVKTRHAQSIDSLQEALEKITKVIKDREASYKETVEKMTAAMDIENETRDDDEYVSLQDLFNIAEELGNRRLNAKKDAIVECYHLSDANDVSNLIKSLFKE